MLYKPYKSFRHYECMNETELSKHCGTQKMVLITVYHGKSKKKSLNFLLEKVSIICADPDIICAEELT